MPVVAGVEKDGEGEWGLAFNSDTSFSLGRWTIPDMSDGWELHNSVNVPNVAELCK